MLSGSHTLSSSSYTWFPRSGGKEFDKDFSFVYHHFKVFYFLCIVQLDHTFLNITLRVRDHHVNCGDKDHIRPWASYLCSLMEGFREIQYPWYYSTAANFPGPLTYRSVFCCLGNFSYTKTEHMYRNLHFLSSFSPKSFVLVESCMRWVHLSCLMSC